MKLDPVFDVAPEPAPRTVTTRRAFLLAGVAGVAGVAGGLGVGHLMNDGASVPVRSDVDPMLRWLLTLCEDSTPVEELIKYRAALLQALPRHREDLALWRGIERLATAAENVTDADESRRIAAELLDFLEHGPSEPAGAIRVDRVRLRMLARGR